MCFKVINVVIIVLISMTYCREESRIPVCDDTSSVDITEGSHLPNGNIVFEGITYEKHEYYKHNETGQERGCFCLKGTCVRKCCPLGYGYDRKQCVKVTEPFDPPIWDQYDYTHLKEQNASKLFHFVIGKVKCYAPSVRIRVGQATKKFHLRMDGKLYVALPESIPPWTVRGADEYCIDTFVYDDPATGSRTTSIDALMCFAETQEDNHYILSSSCMLISCIFILATVAVYGWLPELRNLHGRVLMAYLLCLFVAFIFLATMQILLTVNNISKNTCITLTMFIYFSLLSAFFWLNVMCFDIWWTFSGKGGHSLQKLSIRARFGAYSLYAFGIPSAMTVLLAALEFSGLPPHPLLPMVRDHGCFLNGTNKLIYLYGPIVVLCVANMIFFILTAVKITQIKKQTSVLKSKDSSMHDHHRKDKQRLLLYIKLFAVMGINWILEVISALYPKADMVWQFTDAYNVLIGVIIFIIFVCKRKIFRLIKKRIKEKFYQSESKNGDISDINNIRMRRWQNNHNQRASQETISSTIGLETNSVKTSPL